MTVHSFTPIYNGTRRELGLGVLHDADRRFADAFLAEDEPVSESKAGDPRSRTMRQFSQPSAK